MLLRMLPVLLLSTLTLYAQSEEPVTLSGKLLKPGSAVIRLTSPGMVPLAIPVAADGSFAVSSNTLPRGMYRLDEAGNIFLEPGYVLQILPSEHKYRFRGKGSQENNLLREIKSTRRKFIPQYNNEDFANAFYHLPLTELQQRLHNWKTLTDKLLLQSGNDYFRKIVAGDVDYAIRNAIRMYALNYGTDSIAQQQFYRLMEVMPAKPDSVFRQKFSDALKAIRAKELTTQERAITDSLSYSGVDMNNEFLFSNSAAYRELLAERITSLIFKYYRGGSKESSALLELKVVQETITSPVIREYYIYNKTSDIIKMNESPEIMDSLYEAGMSGISNQLYKKTLREVYDNYKQYSDNKPAPDFEYENIRGEKVKLSSFRGKYVYIDIWATWCVPCKREIPHLTRLDSAYQGKNIRFVSVSVDEAPDKYKWLSFVKEQQLKGEQLLANQDFDSEFIKKFNIITIPRFLLIGPDGRIISANAKRPSSPELRQQLDALL